MSSPLVIFLDSPKANEQPLLCLLSSVSGKCEEHKPSAAIMSSVSSIQRGLCCSPKSSKLFDCFYTDKQAHRGFLKYQTMQTSSWKMSINAIWSSLWWRAHYLLWLLFHCFPKYYWLAFNPVFHILKLTFHRKTGCQTQVSLCGARASQPYPKIHLVSFTPCYHLPRSFLSSSLPLLPWVLETKRSPEKTKIWCYDDSIAELETLISCIVSIEGFLKSNLTKTNYMCLHLP